jgi:serine phosphatase RsbU (regulator of sigma subunit)
VGLFGAARYKQGSLKLEAGDTLVGFTDGISEAMNHHDDEFGEERIVEVVERCDGLPPALVIERMFEAADAFADGAPQHDDMTAVVVRVGV